MTACLECVWVCGQIGGVTSYWCRVCGHFTTKRPKDYNTKKPESEHTKPCENVSTDTEEKCIHDWKCIKERVHNKGDGNGKYRMYRCRLCEKVKNGTDIKKNLKNTIKNTILCLKFRFSDALHEVYRCRMLGMLANVSLRQFN